MLTSNRILLRWVTQSNRMMIQYSVGANFVLFVTKWLRNSGKMKRYPYGIWTVRICTVKFPGDIWIVEIWTVKTWLGLRLGLGFLLGLDLGLGLVLGFELVLLLLLLLVIRLGLVMTFQFMTVQIKTGNHGTASPTFWPMSIVVKRLDGSRCHLVWQYVSA